MRLPDMEHTSRPSDFTALPFTPLYLLGDEFAAEIANRTVRAVMHVGWVPDGSGAYRGQLAVLVKPGGMLGAGYMAAIKPFRNLIVYPRMMRDMGRRWRDGGERRASAGAEETAAAPGGYESPGGHARQIALPPDARALSTLSRIDYEDAFFVSTGPGPDHTGERWARAVLEGAPLNPDACRPPRRPGELAGLLGSGGPGRPR